MYAYALVQSQKKNLLSPFVLCTLNLMGFDGICHLNKCTLPRLPRVGVIEMETLKG